MGLFKLMKRKFGIEKKKSILEEIKPNFGCMFGYISVEP